MRVTLDWDTAAEQQDNLEAAKRAAEGNPWELRRSSSGTGWHFIGYGVANDTPGGFERMMNLRDLWGDDAKRLRLDRKRWNAGSPFMQVLYRRKYMDRTDWPGETGYSTGNVANVVEQSDGVKASPLEEKIKTDDGSLNYPKIARLMYDRLGTQSAVADRLDRARSTVSGYLNDPTRLATLPSDSTPKRRLRRFARSQGIGHYASTDDGGKAADDVRYIDDGDLRRTLVEYIDVPWDWEIGEADREYALLNTHTGSYNDNHSDKQLQAIHNDVTEHVLEALSPSNPETGTKLNLDEQNTHFSVDGWSREPDSINWEREYLDPNEQDVYLDNLPNTAGKSLNAAEQPLFEIILWDEDMTELIWHVIGVWTGSNVRNATILKDSKGWW